MRLNVVALALAAGLLWGGVVLIVASANLVWPGYGIAFLQLVASIYPGYDFGTSPGQVAAGTAYGFVDGAIGGGLFACLYNLLSRWQ